MAARAYAGAVPCEYELAGLRPDYVHPAASRKSAAGAGAARRRTAPAGSSTWWRHAELQRLLRHELIADRRAAIHPAGPCCAPLSSPLPHTRARAHTRAHTRTCTHTHTHLLCPSPPPHFRSLPLCFSPPLLAHLAYSTASSSCECSRGKSPITSLTVRRGRGAWHGTCAHPQERS
jgi:hypothetical protein